MSLTKKTARKYLAMPLEERTRLAEIRGDGYLIDPDLEVLDEGVTQWPFSVLIAGAYMRIGWVWIPLSALEPPC